LDDAGAATLQAGGLGFSRRRSMSTRFAVFALVLAGIIAGAYVSLQSGQPSLLEVFFWLGVMLVVCAVALWPFAGRDQRAELKLERISWADHIEFREPPAVPRTAASARGVPVETRTSRSS
jgi:hypothetical protein